MGDTKRCRQIWSLVLFSRVFWRALNCNSFSPEVSRGLLLRVLCVRTVGGGSDAVTLRRRRQRPVSTEV